ncbi:hypothetical protein TNCV_1076241 [Trichonephila clavipes]|uniref:Uncharacterized protein n=1 Tax=Trichonephila clavipes TaxID=2585209 RepID=A0A8X6RLT4_TRICX|nr:hypothetical protein TNCV_1076241 [Trichonephila clavipes]
MKTYTETCQICYFPWSNTLLVENLVILAKFTTNLNFKNMIMTTVEDVTRGTKFASLSSLAVNVAKKNTISLRNPQDGSRVDKKFPFRCTKDLSNRAQSRSESASALTTI